MSKVLSQEQAARPASSPGLKRLNDRLEPQRMIRWLVTMLRRTNVQGLAGGAPRNWLESGSDHEDEDNEYYYYYFQQPDLNAPRVDINIYKGLVMIRIEK